MANTAPIGIFDSGLGGLSVWRQVRTLLPAESILYFADTANVPYGDKPVSVVRELALRLTHLLAERGCKCVLMASGTSTVAGLDAARAQFPTLPIFGTISGGARAAVQATDGGVGVLATNATARSLAFTQAVQSLAPRRSVVEVGCPRFVPLVETGQADTPDAYAAAREYLVPLLDAGVRAVILGCTHFPFLLPALESVAPSTIFVDPAREAVWELRQELAAQNLLAPHNAVPTFAFAATGSPADFHHHASNLLGIALPPVTSLTL